MTGSDEAALDFYCDQVAEMTRLGHSVASVEVDSIDADSVMAHALNADGSVIASASMSRPTDFTTEVLEESLLLLAGIVAASTRIMARH